MAVRAAKRDQAERRLRDVDQAIAQMEKGQQLAGHYPDAEALDRAFRVLTGEISSNQAYAELAAKYSPKK